MVAITMVVITADIIIITDNKKALDLKSRAFIFYIIVYYFISCSKLSKRGEEKKSKIV